MQARIRRADAALEEIRRMLRRLRVLDAAAEAERSELLRRVAELEAMLDDVRSGAQQLNRELQLRAIEREAEELEDRSRRIRQRSRGAPSVPAF